MEVHKFVFDLPVLDAVEGGASGEQKLVLEIDVQAGTSDTNANVRFEGPAIPDAAPHNAFVVFKLAQDPSATPEIVAVARGAEADAMASEFGQSPQDGERLAISIAVDAVQGSAAVTDIRVSALSVPSDAVVSEAEPAGADTTKYDEQTAATKVQALFRGHKVRRTLKTQPAAQSEQDAPVGEPVAAMYSEEAAATKIQAHFRGHFVRRSMSMVEAKAADSANLEQPAAGAQEQIPPALDVQEQPAGGITEEEAALKIQKVVRGHQVRRSMSMERGEDGQQPAAPEADAASAGADAPAVAGESAPAQEAAAADSGADQPGGITEEEAALKIQKVVRGHQVRRSMSMERGEDGQQPAAPEADAASAGADAPAVAGESAPAQEAAAADSGADQPGGITEEEAALKIQKVVRGHQVRRSMSMERGEDGQPAAPEADAASAGADAPAVAGESAPAQEAAAADSGADQPGGITEDEAALKIQKVVRGHQVRRSMSMERGEDGQQPVALGEANGASAAPEVSAADGAGAASSGAVGPEVEGPHAEASPAGSPVPSGTPSKGVVKGHAVRRTLSMQRMDEELAPAAQPAAGAEPQQPAHEPPLAPEPSAASAAASGITEDEAALKIQKVVRGHQVRRSMSTERGEPEGDTEAASVPETAPPAAQIAELEPLPQPRDEADPAITEDEAALKIQKVVRGHQVRRSMSMERSDAAGQTDAAGQAEAAAAAATTADAASGGEGPEMTEEAAALKIQKVVRGHQVRRSMSMERSQEAGEEPPEEPPAPPPEVWTVLASARPAPADGGSQQVNPYEASVTFVIMPEGYAHTTGLSVRDTVAGAKMTVEKQLKINFNNIKLLFNGEMMANPRQLASYGFAPGGEYSIELQIEYAEAKPARPLPDSLSVTVDFGPGMAPKRMLVKVVAEKKKKPFIGGYRDRRSGAEYLHAQTQTDPPPPTEEQKKRAAIVRFHRDTQTFETRTLSTVTTRECGTQMTQPTKQLPPGHVVGEERDVVLYSRPYFDSQQLEQLRLEKTIKLQCYLRGWRARKLAKRMREEQEAAVQEMEEQQEQQRAVEEDKRRREIERRMHPRSAADFEILYSELEAWRLAETTKINESGLPETERLAALAQLLHKETKLLQTIDRLKISAASENRDTRINSMLSTMSAPKKWAMSDGATTEVHTPFTTRARELMELYNGLRLPLLTIDERLDVLLHVKWTVKEFDCNLTRDLVDLIDREADMLNRGRSEKSLEGLRRRIANLFLQFCETPEFNPEAIRFQKVPRDLLVPPNVRPIVS
eukprot:tig00001003_g6285.t1